MRCCLASGHVFVMRAIVALVVVGMFFLLSGCSPPPQSENPRTERSKGVFPQSQPRTPKFTEASAAKTLTNASRPVSKRSKKFKTHLATSARHQVEAPASPDTGPPLPPRKPELTHINSPATDAESPPSLSPRKPEETPTGPSDSREHAIESEDKFMAAKEKAKRAGVDALTSEDIRGLSQEQIKELRGY
jgi:hypothetical protein